MKTQLLHLDPFDDSASTREKLRWVQADRVVLVWPAYGRILQRRLDLVLLQREALRQGAQLGLVCHDPDVRHHAADLGLPIFDDPERIAADRWTAVLPDFRSPPAPPRPRPTRFEPRPSLQPKGRAPGDSIRRAGWTALVALALLAVAAVVGPVAAVELHPRLVPVQETFTLVLAPQEPEGGDSVWIPARTLRTEVEGQLRLPATGSVLAPTAYAEGRVAFSNVGGAEVVIPEGTGLRTVGEESQRFVTLERSLLPAGEGSQVVVPVRAARAGPEGNVETGAIAAVEGPLGLQVTAANPEPTAGGAEALVPGVTAEDLARVRGALERQLLQEANARWADLLGPGEVLSPESIRVAQVLTFDHDPPLGEQSASLLVSLRLQVESAAYPAEALDQAVARKLRSGLEPGWELFPGSLRVDLTLAPASASQGWAYSAGARAQVYEAGDGASVASSVAGRRRDLAADILRQDVDLVEQPEIRIWPTWWPWLPVLPWRIQIVWAEAGI